MTGRFCADCKWHIKPQWHPNLPIPDRCDSPGIPRDLVTGQRSLRMCSGRRYNANDTCGPNGAEWEPKGEA